MLASVPDWIPQRLMTVNEVAELLHQSLSAGVAPDRRRPATGGPNWPIDPSNTRSNRRTSWD